MRAWRMVRRYWWLAVLVDVLVSAVMLLAGHELVTAHPIVPGYAYADHHYSTDSHVRK